MKKIFFVSIILIFLCCNKDSDDQMSDQSETAEVVSAITEVNATGKVSEQNAEQAKKTIFGKWNLNSSTNNSKTGKKIDGCSYNFIEFTENDYLLNISAPGSIETGGIVVIYGNYELIEVDEKVTKVILKTFYDGTEIDIAEITDIEVVETDGQLDISFSYGFIIDIESIGIPCNNEEMEGDFSADKEPAMEETLTADTSTNHYKIVGTWNLSNYSDSEGGSFSSYFDDDECYEDGVLDPDCSPATSAKLVISTFGTYIYMELAADENIVFVAIGNWDWGNAEQTEFTVTGGPGNAIVNSATVDSITDTQISFTFINVEDEDGTRNETYTFVKAD